MTRYEPMEEKTGSSVLMVCVKETETDANDTLVRLWPVACRNATSVTPFKNCGVGAYGGGLGGRRVREMRGALVHRAGRGSGHSAIAGADGFGWEMSSRRRTAR